MTPQFEHEDTHSPTPSRARIARGVGQRLRRPARNKLKDKMIELTGTEYVQDACKQLGISRACFYAWLRNDADFKTRYDAKLATFTLAPYEDREQDTPSFCHISEGELVKVYKRINRSLKNVWW